MTMATIFLISLATSFITATIGVTLWGAYAEDSRKKLRKRFTKTAFFWGIKSGITIMAIYGVVICIFLIICGNIIEGKLPDRVSSVMERPISALSVNKNLKGSFEGDLFISRGTLDSKDYYVIATVNEEGFSKIEKLPVEQVMYKETNKEVPRVVETAVVRDVTQDKAKFWGLREGKPRISYIIYVPEGSLAGSINIDLTNL